MELSLKHHMDLHNKLWLGSVFLFANETFAVLREMPSEHTPEFVTKFIKYFSYVERRRIWEWMGECEKKLFQLLKKELEVYFSSEVVSLGGSLAISELDRFSRSFTEPERDTDL